MTKFQGRLMWQKSYKSTFDIYRIDLMCRWRGADPRPSGAPQRRERVGGFAPRVHLPPHGGPPHPLESRQLVRPSNTKMRSFHGYHGWWRGPQFLIRAMVTFFLEPHKTLQKHWWNYIIHFGLKTGTLVFGSQPCSPHRPKQNPKMKNKKSANMGNIHVSGGVL